MCRDDFGKPRFVNHRLLLERKTIGQAPANGEAVQAGRFPVVQPEEDVVAVVRAIIGGSDVAAQDSGHEGGRAIGQGIFHACEAAVELDTILYKKSVVARGVAARAIGRISGRCIGAASHPDLVAVAGLFQSSLKRSVGIVPSAAVVCAARIGLYQKYSGGVARAGIEQLVSPCVGHTAPQDPGDVLSRRANGVAEVDEHAEVGQAKTVVGGAIAVVGAVQVGFVGKKRRYADIVRACMAALYVGVRDRAAAAQFGHNALRIAPHDAVFDGQVTGKVAEAVVCVIG